MALKDIHIIIFLLFGIILSSCGQKYSGKQKPMAKDGVINLSDWNFEKDGPLDLKGEWKFFWKELIQAKTFRELSAIQNQGKNFKVPSVWNKAQINGKETKNEVMSFASYLLKLEAPDNNKEIIVYQKDLGSAYELFLIRKNQIKPKLLLANGKVGKNEDSHIPQFLPLKSAAFSLDGDAFLLLHVSNFSYPRSGVWSPFKFGDAKLLEKDLYFNNLRDAGLIGLLLIMGLYHLGLFSLRRSDKPSLFFSIVCFSAAIRQAMSSKFFAMYFDTPSYLGWDIILRAEFVSMYLMIIFFLKFLLKLIHQNWFERAVKVLIAWSIASSIITLFFSVSIYAPYLAVAHLKLLLTVSVVIFHVSREAFRNNANARTCLVGIIPFALTILNDILFQRGFIQTAYLFTYGFAIFILAQSYLLSKLFSEAFNKAEHLSENLKLEVDKQTVELKSQKELIEKQMTYIKEDLKVAAGVMETMMPKRKFSNPKSDLDVCFIPADELAGDIYGHEYKDGKLMFWVCDVTGHGVASSMVAGIVREGIKSYRNDSIFIESPNPALTLKKISDDVAKAVNGSHFATMCLAVFDEKTNEITLSSAAHLKPILCRNGEIKKDIKVTNGPLIGINDARLARTEYTNAVIKIEDGDFFFIYTDGVNEASKDQYSAQFGIRKIKRLIKAHYQDQNINNLILDSVIKFQEKDSFDDDITMIALRT